MADPASFDTFRAAFRAALVHAVERGISTGAPPSRVHEAIAAAFPAASADEIMAAFRAARVRLPLAGGGCG
jgi:hypothetical protein